MSNANLLSASSPPSLDTGRLHLRTLVDDDAPAIVAIYTDPDAMRYWSTSHWTDPDEASRLIARDRQSLADGDAVRFGLVERGSREVIGCCSLHRIDWGNRRAEVGYILRPSHWRRGLMHEAMRAVVDFAFGPLALRRLEADIDPRNDASERTVKRLGFAREGYMPGRWLIDGIVCDTVFYGLLAETWSAAASAPADAKGSRG